MGEQPVVLTYADVVVVVDETPVGEAELEISGVPERAITGWGLVNVELWPESLPEFENVHPSNMRCYFKIPEEAFAFLGAVTPGRFGKDG